MPVGTSLRPVPPPSIWIICGLCVICGGCSASVAPAATHEHTAPHGGTLVELGDEFAHVELVLDPAAGTLTAYALDGEAETGVRIAQPTVTIALVLPGQPPREVTLAAVPSALTGETASESSQFRATVPALAGATIFDGAIKRVVVRGTPFEDVSFRFPSDGHD